MDKKLDLILDELRSLNTRVASIETGQNELNQRVGNLEIGQKELTKRVEGIEAGQKVLTKRVEGIEAGQSKLENGQNKLEAGQMEMTKRAESIENELKDFRIETKTALQIIQTGQQGTREEMTQRFKEMKHTLSHLESDIAYTFQKTAEHELKLNRIKNL